MLRRASDLSGRGGQIKGKAGEAGITARDLLFCC
jgi:hypothetical protein